MRFFNRLPANSRAGFQENWPPELRGEGCFRWDVGRDSGRFVTPVNAGGRLGPAAAQDADVAAQRLAGVGFEAENRKRH